MKKKFLVLSCALALFVSAMTGCGITAAESAATEAASETKPEEEAVQAEEAPEETPAETETEKPASEISDQVAADATAALIDAIYVQEWTEDTEKQCADAKAAWDALTDAQKELVEGEEADPDYFGRDTGDAS